MGKRCRTARLEQRTIDSAFQEFRVDYEQTKHFANGRAITSDTFSAGGYIWRVHYFPNGFREADKGSISLLFELMSNANVNVITEAFITVKDGHPWSPCEDRKGVVLLEGDKFNMGGWGGLVSQAVLEKYYLVDGHVTIVCAIMVVRESSLPAPASDIGKHFVSERPLWTRLDGRTIDSAFHEFRVDYEQTKHLGIGKAICSDAFSVDRYMWRVHYYPHGCSKSNKSYVSICIELVSKSRPVNAICEAFIMDKDGQACPYSAARSNVVPFEDLGVSDKCGGGWHQFILRTDLEKYYLTEGHITFVCAIMVVPDTSIPVPPSDIKKHFSNLPGSTDVSFSIDGETFHAHRAVLAARSPVLKALMSSITLHDIAPATFRVMLQFMYTDALPEDDELGDTPEMMQQLLAAADRYGLDQLKQMCAQKLGDNVSVDTVAATLTCAEMYDCLELKNKCIDFFVMEGNFKKAMLTKGFVQLGQRFPSIIDELRERVGL